MSDPIDMSREKRVDWDRELDAGNLVRADPTKTNRALQGEHVQGVPINDANRHERVISADQAKRMMEQAQSSPSGAWRPAPSGGKTSVICNWPFPRAPKPPTP